MPKYEVAVHNEDVRKLVKDDERHKDYTDDWADMHYIEIEASNEGEVRRKIEGRYPADKGFRIDQISMIEP